MYCLSLLSKFGVNFTVRFNISNSRLLYIIFYLYCFCWCFLVIALATVKTAFSRFVEEMYHSYQSTKLSSWLATEGIKVENNRWH